MSIDPERRRALVESKLRSLVRAHLRARTGEDLAETDGGRGAPTGIGATVWNGRDLWMYAPDTTTGALGRALGLATTADAASLHLVVDANGGDDARRAGLVVMDAHVYRVDGTSLSLVEPVALATPADPPAGEAVAGLVAMLQAARVSVVVEHGVILGEIRGLEVARVRMPPAGDHTAGAGTIGEDTSSPSAVLDVGVGRFDQEAAALLHGHLPTAAALAQAVELVRRHRHSGAQPHPLNRLGRERWLRSQLVDEPSRIGLSELVAISPPLPRRNVKDPAPAAAMGLDESGTVLVVTTVGVDLEWLPFTVDLVDRERPGRVIVALPRRDLLPLQHRLLDQVPAAATLIAVDGDWPG